MGINMRQAFLFVILLMLLFSFSCSISLDDGTYYRTTVIYESGIWVNDHTIAYVRYDLAGTYKDYYYHPISTDYSYYSVYTYDLQSGRETLLYRSDYGDIANDWYVDQLIAINDSVFIKTDEYVYFPTDSAHGVEADFSQVMGDNRYVDVSEDSGVLYYSDGGELYRINRDGTGNEMIFYAENVRISKFFESSIGTLLVSAHPSDEYLFVWGDSLYEIDLEVETQSWWHDFAFDEQRPVHLGNVNYINYFMQDSNEIIEFIASDYNTYNRGLVRMVNFNIDTVDFYNELTGLRSSGGDYFLTDIDEEGIAVIDSNNNVLFIREMEEYIE